MTYLKTLITAATATSILAGTSAIANDAPASFKQLDQDKNSIINFSEYAIDAQKHEQDLTTALRQFNVISNGEQTFTQEQYASSFALQGGITARDSDKTVIMPAESEKVLGAIATGVILEDLDAMNPAQSTSDLIVHADITKIESSNDMSDEDGATDRLDVKVD